MTFHRCWSLLLAVLTSGRKVVIPTREIAPGVFMPELSIGTGGLEKSNASEIVRNWLELGGRGVDTAMVYGDQDVVAKAIAEMKINRKDVFITTKVPTCVDVQANVEKDLSLLGTDYIDLLLIHFPMGDCAAGWKVLEDFHQRGVLRAIGVSNFNKSSLQDLMKTAKVKPAVNQIQLNVINHDDETIAYSISNGITVEAYSPLGRANHSGDITGNKLIKEVALSHNVTTFQVAIKWILQHGHLLTFQSTSQKHQASDADVYTFNLTDSEMSALDKLQEPSLSIEFV